MPNYEYECKTCAAQWEDIHPIAQRDTPTTLPCPHCGHLTVCRGWNHSPTMGTDSTRKPQGAFRDRLNAMRDKLGKYNPTVRQNIDRSLDLGGGQYGPR